MTGEEAIERLELLKIFDAPDLAKAVKIAAAALRAQQEPGRTHGYWQGEGDGYADGEMVYDVWHCSNCGYVIDDGTNDPELLPHYCPDCGAQMDGGVVQPAAKLDRSRWKGCEYCLGEDPEGIVTFEIPDEVELSEEQIKFGWIEAPRYCPICSRPLTEEAWAELEQRIGGCLEIDK